MIYYIKETLESVESAVFDKSSFPFCAVLTYDGWLNEKDRFGIYPDRELLPYGMTSEAIVNTDCLCGGFSIPNRAMISESFDFRYVLNETGVVFIDDSGYCLKSIERLRKERKWNSPCLARFLYAFLELIIESDLKVLDEREKTLNRLEADIINGNDENAYQSVNDIRGDLLDLRTHYAQLVDVAQEFEENENEFFAEEQLKYFGLFADRVIRLETILGSLRDYATQVNDLIRAQQEVKQNHIMTILTVVTTVFAPLTLITGWYGMNFKYMPELDQPWGYPAVFLLSITVSVICIVFFKKRKWL